MFVVSLKKSLPCVLAATLAVGVLAGVDAPAFSGTPLAPAVASAAISKSYDFSQNIGSWAYAGNYSYSGQASAAYDPAFGGSLRLSVDFSKDKDATWREGKRSDTGITDSTPLEVANCNVLEFDLYYDPAKIGGDSMFKVKVFGKDVKGDEVINDLADDIGMSRAKAVDGSTLKRVHVKVPLMDGFTGKLSHLEVSIVSYLSGYQGDVYINNLKL